MKNRKLISRTVGLLIFFSMMVVPLGSVSYAETNAPSYILQWGEYGELTGQIKNPRGIATDENNNVYLADGGNHRIQKFDSNGNFLLQWGEYGTGDGQFYGVSDVAVDSSGNVFVADSMNKRIQKFTSNGDYISQWTYRLFNFNNGLTVDKYGNVYVTDQNFCLVAKFDNNGEFLLGTGGGCGDEDGKFYQPMGIATDSLGNVYVADAANHRIQKFDSSLNFISKWGTEGSLAGEFNRPTGIAIDSEGYVYVTDSQNDRIQKFDSNGNYLAQWGSQGSENGEFDAPLGIAINSDDEIYITDFYNYRVQKFAYLIPELGINYVSGSPGSYFNINGTNFPPNSTATILINSTIISNSIVVDNAGNLQFILNTDSADNGFYVINVSVNPSASISFVLEPEAPLRPLEGSGEILNVPAGSVFSHSSFLPLVLR
jgi:DNA-binding beta-propeller fold protein YncE